jgi:hypothetical protein
VGQRIRDETSWLVGARGAELALSALLGAGVGIASSSFATGGAVFVGAMVVLTVGHGAYEAILRRSPVRVEQLVREQVRKAGIDDRRPGGGDLFTELVLVNRRTLIGHEVFDQDGRLMIATGRSPSESKLGRLFSSTGIYSTPGGRSVLRVLVDRNVNTRTYIAADADGTELGAISVRGKEKGAIRAGGSEIGRLRRCSKPLASAGRTAFCLYDENSTEVARITTTTWALVRWSVIEAKPGLGNQLRRLLLAADAAVDDWTTPRGGG